MISHVSESFKNFASLASLILKFKEVHFYSGHSSLTYHADTDALTESENAPSGFEIKSTIGSIYLASPLIATELVIFKRLLSTFETEFHSRFYKSILDHMDEAVVACDQNGTLKFFNQKTKELHGLPEETIPADKWADHYDIYTPDLKSLMPKEKIPLFRAFSGEVVSNIEMMIARKGQRPIFIQSNARPMYDNEGKKVGALATMREESQIKQKLNTIESRFNAIFLQSPLSIQICSRDGKTLLVNPAWKKLWQIPEDVIQNFIMKDYNMLEDPNLKAQGVMDYIRRGFEGEVSRIPIIKYDVKGLGIEGSQRSVEGWIYPLKNILGKVEEIVLIHIDVTEKEHLVEELKQAVLQREEFISIASHELKTPITSMKLQLQLLDKVMSKNETGKLDPGFVKKFTDITTRQLGRITLLVDDMLDFSRITSGKLAIVPKETNVSHLVKEVIQRFVPSMDEKQIKFDFSFEPDIHAVCDAFRIEQVVINLMTNAIRYGLNKPISVDLKKEQDDVVISFTDQGPGIETKDLNRIFEKFERASDESISGLGLGLFISRQIMELHHGSLTVKSSPGQGSTFTARWNFKQNDE